MTPKNKLLGSELEVVNIGLEGFAESLRSRNVPVSHVDWRPPAGGDEHLLALLKKAQLNRDVIEQANQVALQRIVDADPVLTDILPAKDAIPGLAEGLLLHAGPPVDWADMCGPMRAAIIGAIRYEGWAKSESDAESMAERGDVKLLPNHDFNAVGPMTGITSMSMPVFVVENRSFGNKAFCTINEGIGKVMRFGANDDQVIERLRWLQNTLAPALQAGVRRAGGVELRSIMARAVSMGDEMHQRNVAATSLFIRAIAPHLVRASTGDIDLAEVMEFITGNDQFFLNLAMAAGKATMDPIQGIPNSSVVSAMSRNGKEFGLRVSGIGDRWFTAPSLMPNGLYFPGYSASDANPDMGDSSIIETMGLGGFAMAGAPAVVGFVGAGTYQDAVNYTREMGEITVGQHTHIQLPTLDFQGTPCGIDIIKVIESGIAPVINTGIAHKQPGVGQVGAGIVRAPSECFAQALEVFVIAVI